MTDIVYVCLRQKIGTKATTAGSVYPTITSYYKKSLRD